MVSANKQAADTAIGLVAPANPEGLESARALAAEGDRLAARGGVMRPRLNATRRHCGSSTRC